MKEVVRAVKDGVIKFVSKDKLATTYVNIPKKKQKHFEDLNKEETEKGIGTLVKDAKTGQAVCSTNHPKFGKHCDQKLATHGSFCVQCGGAFCSTCSPMGYVHKSLLRVLTYHTLFK